MPNTGAGIAEDDLQRIYSLFFRPEHAWRIDNAGTVWAWQWWRAARI